jgi:hypothetical protein
VNSEIVAQPRRTAAMEASESLLPAHAPPKTKSPFVLSGAISRRMASAGADSGTRCFRPDFMRSAEIVHVAASRSISLHVAPMVSPVHELD